MRFGQNIFYNMQNLCLTWGKHFTPDFLHVFVKFMERKASTKFYGVLIIFQKVMKFRSWVQLHVSDFIPTNVHNMHFSAVYIVLREELIWFRSSENTFFVVLGSFFVFVSFTFLVYVEKFNLQWAEMPSCKSIYCSNGTWKTADKISYFPFSNPKT